MNIPKSPSLQLLRKLHHQFTGFNDISVSSEDDWDSICTSVVHRHSGYFSARTSRCSSIVSLALDWDSDRRETRLTSNLLTIDAAGKGFNSGTGFLLSTMLSSSVIQDRDEEEEQLSKGEENSATLNVPLIGAAKCEAGDAAKADKETAAAKTSRMDLNSKCEEPSKTKKEDKDLAKRIFVKNLSDNTTERLLWSFFGSIAKVSNVYLLKDQKTRKSRRMAFVQFASVEDAQKILAMDSTELVLNGRSLYVDAAKPKQQKTFQTVPLSDYSGWPYKNKQTSTTQAASPPVATWQCEYKPSGSKVGINDLPCEILEHIFSFLSLKNRIQMESVCKHWKKLGMNAQWKVGSLTLADSFTGGTQLSDMKFRSILRRCGLSLKNLDLSGCLQDLTYRALDIISEYCPNLESVNFGSIPVTNTGLKIFSTKCVKIKKAIIRNNSFGEKGLWWVLKNCKDLEYLDLTGNNRVKGLCFHIINKQVKVLILDKCTKMTTKGFLELKRCTCIETLILDDCSAVDDEVLKFLLEHFSHSLRTLHLGGRLHIHPYHTIFQCIKNLNVFSVANYYDFDDNALHHVALNCPNLQKLDIRRTQVSSYGLQELINCPQLKDLNISHLSDEINDGLEILAMAGNLVRLTVQGSRSLTDDICITLGEHCKELEHFDIASCIHITDSTVDEFIEIVERQDRKTKLEVIAGGTLITNFVDNPRLAFIDINTCPMNLRPFEGLFAGGLLGDDDNDYLYDDEDDDFASSDGDYDEIDDCFDDALEVYEYFNRS